MTKDGPKPLYDDALDGAVGGGAKYVPAIKASPLNAKANNDVFSSDGGLGGTRAVRPDRKFIGESEKTIVGKSGDGSI